MHKRRNSGTAGQLDALPRRAGAIDRRMLNEAERKAIPQPGIAYDRDRLRSRTDQRQATEMNVAVAVLNRILELGRPKSVRIA
jgi:hypothetical protein